MIRYAIYDDSKTFDRYTLRILLKTAELTTNKKYAKDLILRYGKLINQMYGFSTDPFHPQGFGQYCGEYKTSKTYKHLGKLIKLENLPEQAQKYVKQVLKDYEKV